MADLEKNQEGFQLWGWRTQGRFSLGAALKASKGVIKASAKLLKFFKKIGKVAHKIAKVGATASKVGKKLTVKAKTVKTFLKRWRNFKGVMTLAKVTKSHMKGVKGRAARDKIATVEKDPLGTFFKLTMINLRRKQGGHDARSDDEIIEDLKKELEDAKEKGLNTIQESCIYADNVEFLRDLSKGGSKNRTCNRYLLIDQPDKDRLARWNLTQEEAQSCHRKYLMWSARTVLVFYPIGKINEVTCRRGCELGRCPGTQAKLLIILQE